MDHYGKRPNETCKAIRKNKVSERLQQLVKERKVFADEYIIGQGEYRCISG
tara:strand:- start:171 stop:323 length:153 start_codon:yes stop_codon:yes gene_type:complete